MRQEKLLVLANVLALIIACWLWMDLDASKRSLAYADSTLEKSSTLAEEIKSLRSELKGRVVIMDSGFDPSGEASKAVKNAKLYDPRRFFLSEGSSRNIGQTGVKRCNVVLPKYQLSLRQLLNLVSCLDDAEPKFQVANVILSRPDKDKKTTATQANEVWDVELKEVVYLKAAKGGK